MKRYWLMITLFMLAMVILIQGCIADECDSDSDCVPSACCHSSSCVALENAPDCSGVACTFDCRPDSLDCGQGSCACVDGRCTANMIQ